VSRIAVAGTGYVGLTTGVCFAHLGHTVSCIDVDQGKIDSLRAGEVPIFEPGLEELIRETVGAGRLSFTSDYDVGLESAEFVFIAVGTPTAADGVSADTSYLRQAAHQIATSLGEPAIIVNKSTSPIGTAFELQRILELDNPTLAPWVVVTNPEFLREGSAVFDCLHPSRIVLGAVKPSDCDKVARLYAGFDCPIIRTDLPSAEMIKYASNAFLATKISFINEVARICQALDADVNTVADGMGMDARIGRAGMNAGLGYGGSCFPKDVAALSHMAESAGLHPQLLKAVTDINDDQRRWAVDSLAEALAGLEGRTVAIWGLTFKPETDDLRFSPAVDIARRLIEKGASIRAYDPEAGATGLPIVTCRSAADATADADALLVATEWAEFLSVNWESIARAMRGNLVLDGRNCLDPARVEGAGLNYLGVGRRCPAASEELLSAR
jgi:UDPglucose 6-dehydrogenase